MFIFFIFRLAIASSAKSNENIDITLNLAPNENTLINLNKYDLKDPELGCKGD